MLKKQMLVIALIYPLCTTIVHSFAEQEDMHDEPLNLVLHDESQPYEFETEIDSQEEIDDEESDPNNIIPAQSSLRRINDIIVTGNNFTPTSAILTFIPYTVGEIFKPQKSRLLIRNLYFGLERFHNITVKAEPVGNDLVNVIIEIEEKPILKDVIIQGNKQITEKEIQKKVSFDVPAIDEYELKRYAEKIKQVYAERGYHQTEIDTALDLDFDNKAIATFIIREKKRSILKRIFFEGNQNFSDSQLKSIIFSQEDWALGFLNQAGIYQQDRLEGDKFMIEQFYQNHGYLHGRVIDVSTMIEEGSKNQLHVTYEIEEGSRYTISNVSINGNETLSEEYLLSILPVRKGDYYSRENIANSIKLLEFVWGNHGYIFASIEPSVEPNEDDKTVSISFFCDLGNKIFLNRLNIKGNKKTRDKIIRRRISLQESELITNQHMDISKQNVESLGYFDVKEGVNWRLRRIDEEHADLDLMLKETKTGNFNVQMGFGGSGIDIRSPNSAFTFKGTVSDRNLFGLGINSSLEGSWAKDETTLNFHLGQPWLFDKPISAAIDIYHKRPIYDELKYITPNTVSEIITGGALTAGIITQARSAYWSNIQLSGSIGADNLIYKRHPLAAVQGFGAEAVIDYQYILDRQFRSGTILWLIGNMEQDTRNHPMHPSRGFAYKFTTRFAVPVGRSGERHGDLGFFKATLDTNFFTPLIGEHLLVLHIRGFLGAIAPFKNKFVPFGELYHIGGPSSVRGFLYGQIGPQFLGDTIGGTRAMFVNVELVFPITPDMNMKGVVFYDGGTGWHNPNIRSTDCKFVTGNNFDYRHAVGVGVRLLNPMPIRIDWGFKLDPRSFGRGENRRREAASEVHFGMNYDW